MGFTFVQRKKKKEKKEHQSLPSLADLPVSFFQRIFVVFPLNLLSYKNQIDFGKTTSPSFHSHPSRFSTTTLCQIPHLKPPQQQPNMEEGDSLLTLRKWDDLNSDILRKIFGSFDYINDATSAISQVRCSAVCIGWRSILCDSQLWNVLDLSWLKSNFIKIHQEPYVYVDSRSDETLSRVLKVSLSLSRGNVTTLVLNPELYISDDQLTFTAERYVGFLFLILVS